LRKKPRQFHIYPRARTRNFSKSHKGLWLLRISHGGLWLVQIFHKDLWLVSIFLRGLWLFKIVHRGRWLVMIFQESLWMVRILHGGQEESSEFFQVSKPLEIWRNMKEIWRIKKEIWRNMKELWRIRVSHKSQTNFASIKKLGFHLQSEHFIRLSYEKKWKWVVIGGKWLLAPREIGKWLMRHPNMKNYEEGTKSQVQTKEQDYFTKRNIILKSAIRSNGEGYLKDSRHRAGNKNMFHVPLWRNMKEIWRNMIEVWRNFSKSQVLGGNLEFFQVLEPWRKLKIFPSPRNMKKCEEVWRKYEGIWKNMKKIW